MRSIGVAASAALLLALGAGWFTANPVLGDTSPKPPPPAVESVEPAPTQGERSANANPEEAVEDGVAWLARVQGEDGGWGQDGGATSYAREGENLETVGNDLANTAVATLALLRSGSTPTKGRFSVQVRSGLEFILRGVEQSPSEGLALKTMQGTQIQRKLGPYIDTFLTSKLLGELDGETGDRGLDKRVRAALERCVAKIEGNQMEDGSWNLSGGWAPILGTSLASQSLAVAESKGVAVDRAVMAQVGEYTEKIATGSGGAADGDRAREMAGAASAGVDLYKDAQVLEQLTRSQESRKANKEAIAQVRGKLADSRFQAGYGSMGGEEFFSYLNISDSLRREGGESWRNWNRDIKTKLVTLQNGDGSWAGHHCITGRVAVTGAAVLALTADQQPAPAL